MTSIERTAYPQFKKLISARMLHLSFTPTADEVTWARGLTNTPEALFAVVLALKCYQKMARFPAQKEIPAEVVDHVRRCLDLGEDIEPDHGAGRTTRWHRKQIRTRQGVTNDPPRARKIAAEAIRDAARSKNYPPDLINVALDRLVEASLELPGFTTLDEMAARIRSEVNAEIFAQVNDRMGEEGQARLKALVAVAEDGYSMFNRLKKPAKRASWSRFKAQVAYMAEVDELGDTHTWLEGITPSKIGDFAGEAAAQDADTLSRYDPVKRLALVACLVHTARMRARDDLADPVPRTVGIGAHTTSVWLYACPACDSRAWAELTPDQYVDVRYLVDHPAMDPFTQASLPPVEGRWQPADGIRAFGVRSITEPRVLFPDHDPACAYCEHGPNSVDCATRVPGPAEDAFVCRDCRTELARARIAADPRNHDDYGWEE